MQQKYVEVSALLDVTIEQVYTHEHRDWILKRVEDFFMYYNNTCSSKGFDNFATKLAAFASKRDQFETPPSSP